MWAVERHRDHHDDLQTTARPQGVRRVYISQRAGQTLGEVQAGGGRLST